MERQAPGFVVEEPAYVAQLVELVVRAADDEFEDGGAGDGGLG